MKACHKYVAGVAREAAGQLYEQLMKDDLLWKMWRQQNEGLSDEALERRFIEKNWGKCIDFARATMGHMLSRPDIDQKLKDEIYEALQLDSSLPVGRYGRSEANALLGRVKRGMMN